MSRVWRFSRCLLSLRTASGGVFALVHGPATVEIAAERRVANGVPEAQKAVGDGEHGVGVVLDGELHAVCFGALQASLHSGGEDAPQLVAAEAEAADDLDGLFGIRAGRKRVEVPAHAADSGCVRGGRACRVGGGEETAQSSGGKEIAAVHDGSPGEDSWIHQSRWGCKAVGC
jgi:hypothetical protein